MENKRDDEYKGYKNDETSDGYGYVSVPIHSQVMRIKREFEKIKHPSLQQPEMRRVFREIAGRQRQRSRSPLGLGERPISVGN